MIKLDEKQRQGPPKKTQPQGRPAGRHYLAIPASVYAEITKVAEDLKVPRRFVNGILEEHLYDELAGDVSSIVLESVAEQLKRSGG